MASYFETVSKFTSKFLLLCLLTVLVSVKETASSLSNSGKESSAFRKEASINGAADIINFMKLNRPQDGNRVHLNKEEVNVILQRIKSSDSLDELRELSKMWRGKHEARISAPPPDWPWKVDPDVFYNMSGLVWSKGYPIEEYEVQTQDGYILGLFRIPHGRTNSTKSGSKPAVFLQHGLLAASTNWVENPANESLGFLLADAGYDVWMGNMRGNTYSRKHVSLDPDKLEFWQFSWDQMAKYDIPALVNFALKKSNQSQLAYVGHSQGTLVAFTGLSMNPDLAQKVTTLFALGPVYTVKDINIYLRDLISDGLVKLLADVLTIAGIDEFLPNNYLTNKLGAQTLCAWPETQFICENVLLFLGGYSQHHMNLSRIQVYVSKEPAGTSLRNMEHFLQMVLSGKCQMYDYGLIGNLVRYNSTTPPEYHVENLTTPVALFWGVDDVLADPEDVERLIPKIPHLIYNKKIENFEHLDFIWAMDAKSILYDDIISIMRGKVPKHNPMPRSVIKHV